MTHKRTNISKRVLFLYCMLGGLIFLFLPPSVTGKVQLAYARVFRVPLEGGRVVTLESLKAPASKTISHEEYTRLLTIQRRQANHIANLQAQLDEARLRIDDLAGMRNVPEWNRMTFQMAGIISDPEQVQNELLINLGTKHGLAAGQFVLGDNSVIGTVSRVSEQTAKVKLITDPKSRIAVRVAGLDARGVMEGRGPGLAAIPQVMAKQGTKVGARVGDKVYALKTPGYPGVTIVTAEVVACKRDPENPILWEITVRPVCDITNLRNVAVAMSGE